ncbi:MAG: hypothetical protein GOU99_03030 [Candidatus Altiarchaeota archaeon]|nr:hypothetical protein [Candidatus Altiarchaeota archaeon]
MPSVEPTTAKSAVLSAIQSMSITTFLFVIAIVAVLAIWIYSRMTR